MKLTKQKLVTLIEEVLKESTDLQTGTNDGYSDGKRLAIQHKGKSLQPDNDGNTPLRDEIMAEFESKIEGMSEDYATGYEFGFRQFWSALWPSTVRPGQEPYANAAGRAFPGVFGWRG
tara:strand:+ start:91 stop:444 length:354 start_codon:yes stop_codon:yes gene_type:complete